MNQEDLLNVTSGWIINLVAGDLQRFELSALSIFLLPQAVLEVCSISCLMVYFFGWKPLSGVAFMVSLALYYGIAGQISLRLRTKISRVADQRVDVMNSIISGIRAVKMYAWEGSFMEKVKRLRRYITYTLFDGLAYNTCGYFASCVYFSSPLRGSETDTSNEQNVRSYYMLNHRIRCM